MYACVYESSVRMSVSEALEGVGMGAFACKRRRYALHQSDVSERESVYASRVKMRPKVWMSVNPKFVGVRTRLCFF